MSTKSKKKINPIETLMNDLIATDMYHPQVVKEKNRELNRAIYEQLKRETGKNTNLYMQIKEITDQLAILAHAAVLQPVQVRTMSNQQFETIQKQLKQLKHKLHHRQ